MSYSFCCFCFLLALYSSQHGYVCVCARIVKDEYIIFIHEVVNILKCTHSARAYFTGENGCKLLFCFVVFFSFLIFLFSIHVVVGIVVFAFWFDSVLVVLYVTMLYIMVFLLFYLKTPLSLQLPHPFVLIPPPPHKYIVASFLRTTTTVAAAVATSISDYAFVFLFLFRFFLHSTFVLG